MSETSFQLWQGDTLLGTLPVAETDMFWTFCGWEPEPAFAALKPLFERERALLEEEDEDAAWDAWEAVYAEIMARGLRLTERGSGASYDDFILHIAEDAAWFRLASR